MAADAPTLAAPPAARRGRALSWPALLLAALCGAAGLALAAHYPLSGVAAVAAWLATALAAWRWPRAWLVWLPALLPAIGLMPWTGWTVVEELDLLVLAIAAGGYAAWHTLPPPRPRSGPRALVPVLLALFAASLVLAVHRGAADAGGWAFGWWQGYREPLNALRQGKGFLLALLLLPLWRRAVAADDAHAARLLGAGLAAGLAVVGLLVVWERIAFPGLLNFSSDYRVVALFWEMHVGGAALDAFLALTMPFGVALLARARTRGGWLLGACATGLGAHACLVTFSRIDYVAIPVGVAVTLALLAAQRRRGGQPGEGATGRAAVLIVAFAAAAAWVFGSSGYRGMLALLGLAVVLLALGGKPPALAGRARWQALAAALVACAGVGVAAAALPKGAYVGYALLWSAAMALAFIGRGALAAGAAAALPLAALAVAWHWGGAPALGAMAWPAAGVLVLLAALLARGRPLWPPSRRWQGSTAGAMAACAAVIGVFGGGAYMGDRLATSSADAEYRVSHWRHVIDLLDSPLDWAVGKGLGRFPERLFLAGVSPEYQTGDLRLVESGESQHVAMTGGRHEIDWGQVLRLSQRIDVPNGAPVVEVDVMASASTGLHFEVCEKHLLYNARCRVGNIQVPPSPGAWQHLKLQLGGDPVTRGAWWAPRIITFSTGVLTRGGRLELDNLSLRDADGRELLVNGSFDRGLARWYLSSDHHHMPWHEKSLPFYLLFGQGLVGLGLFTLLAAGALWRVAFGTARDHPLAPPLAGAFIALYGVGLIDSLFDAPRIAWLFYLLLLVALTLPKAFPGRTGPASA